MSSMLLPRRLSAPNSSATVQLRPAWARRPRSSSAVEPARGLDLGGQHRCVVGADPQPLEPLALGVGQLGQRGAAFLEERLVELERQQVRIGEVAIIVRIFLRPQRAGDVLVGIVEAGFLDDLAALLQHLDLALRLMLDHRHDEADRVDVLGLGAGAELAADFAHADIDVGAHRAFLHIAVARADIAENCPELPKISPCFGGRTHVGPRHDLHQRDARAVEVDVAHGRMLVVHQLARVLLDMDALDADLLDAILVLLVEQNLDFARPDQRMVELRDLIALRQVGVEVILAVEPAPAVDHRVQRHAGAHRLADALAVGDRQHAGHGRVDQANLAVGLGPERGRRAGEELGVGDDLGMDLEADHDLPIAGFALDAVGAFVSLPPPLRTMREPGPLLDREAGVRAPPARRARGRSGGGRAAGPGCRARPGPTWREGRRGWPGPRTRRSDTSPADPTSSPAARTPPTARSGSGSGRTA